MAISPQKVATGVHRVADGAVNWYLVERAGRVALVDAGWPRSFGRVEQALSGIGRSMADVAVVLLTHGHPDHLGAAEKVRTASGAPVRAHELEADRVRGTAPGSSPFALVPSLTLQLWRPSTAKFVGGATANGFITPTWVKEVDPFATDDELEVPGNPRVIGTPGHTEGHCSFFFEDAGVLISGDALVTRDPITGFAGHPCLTHDVVNGDPGLSRSSLDVIETVGGDLLLPGHGEPWRGVMADAAEKARQRAGPV